MTTRPSCLTTATLLAVLAGTPIRAQDAALQGEYAFEDEVRFALAQGKRGALDPRREGRRWLVVDSLRPEAGGGRRLHLVLRRHAGGRDTAIVVAGADGRIRRSEIGLAPASFERSPDAFGGPRAAAYRWRYGDERGFTLPEAQLWDVVPVVGAPLRRGARWTDTLDRVADRDDHRQALRGRRTSTVVGDTVVDGRRLWRVRDSATVRYEERQPEWERTLATFVTIEHAYDGTIVGTWLLDSALGLARTRTDSSSFAGTATLRYPDGRHFSAPAWRAEVRRLTLLDGAQYAARRAALREESMRRRGGMVLSEAETAQHRQARDDEGRRMAAGDTALLYRHLASRAHTRGNPVDTAEMRAMRWFMADPARPWAWGQSRDWMYENLRQSLTTWPPAAMADSAEWPCRIDACRALAAEWPGAREPRLRALGLMARVALDPARWSDTLFAAARDTATARFVAPMLMLVRGIGATWPAASQRPMPDAGAGWTAWLEWMNGRNPAASTFGQAVPRASARPAPRFEESHAVAIRFMRARTGRDVVAELRRGWQAAPHDTARLVFGTMLQGLGALRLGSAELATMLRSGAPARIALAQRVLPALMRDSATLADSALAGLLLDRLIAATLERSAPWPSLGAPAGAARRDGLVLHATPAAEGVYVLADSLPPSVAAGWRGRARLVTAEEWRRQPEHEAGVLYHTGAVRRLGPFVELSIAASERLRRARGQAAERYASWARYWLMEVDGAWVIVAQSTAVT